MGTGAAGARRSGRPARPHHPVPERAQRGPSRAGQHPPAALRRAGGQAVIESPAGQAVIGAIRERSTAAFREINVETGERFGADPPLGGGRHERGAAVRAARPSTWRPTSRRGSRSRWRTARTFAARGRWTPARTGDFEAGPQSSPGPKAGRPRLLARRGHPARPAGHRPDAELPRPPAGNGSRARLIAVAACASQFGPIFDHLAAPQPGRLRLAGRPELSGHPRPAGPDGERLRRDLARLPGQPADRARARPALLRRRAATTTTTASRTPTRAT